MVRAVSFEAQDLARSSLCVHPGLSQFLSDHTNSNQLLNTCLRAIGVMFHLQAVRQRVSPLEAPPRTKVLFDFASDQPGYEGWICASDKSLGGQSTARSAGSSSAPLPSFCPPNPFT